MRDDRARTASLPRAQAHPTTPIESMAGVVRRVLARDTARSTLVAGAVAFLVYELTRSARGQPQNTYVYLADALLHGRLDMPDAPMWLDWVRWRGRKFSHQGPLPGVLLMPFVAVFGLGFDVRHGGALFGAGIGAAAWSVAGRIGLRGWRRVAAWMFPVFGTSIWYEAKEGSTWGIAALGSALFLLLALNEYFGKRRPEIVGLLVALAALNRLPAILAAGGFALAMWRTGFWRLAIGASLAPVVVVLYNVARFGSVMDQSAVLFYLADAYRFQRAPGIFSLRHLPYNLYSWLVLMPTFQDTAPFLRPTIMGTSLTITSPAFLTALGTKRERWMWVSAGLVMVPAGLFFANGFAQFGMRYLLDAVPFLFAMVCLALADDRAPGYVPLTAWSVAFVAFGVAYTNHFGLQP